MAEIGKDIEKAKNYLKEGKLIAIPTETVYGLAANAFNPDAVASVFRVKNRPSFDPLIVHISNIDKLEHLVRDIPEQAYQLANNFWPGPLTLLLPKNNIIPDLVTSGMEHVAIRIPKHPLIKSLLSELDFPIVAPSANPFGYVSPTKASHVDDQLGNKIPYILDGGECIVGIESTIVGFEDRKPIIYRQGGISLEELEAVLGTVKMKKHSTSNPKAPGMLKSHYSPMKPLILGNIDELISTVKSRKIGILTFKETYVTEAHAIQKTLAPDGKMETAAKTLFSILREMDELDIDLILAEEVPDHGLGRAINDRLRRAAAPKETKI